MVVPTEASFSQLQVTLEYLCGLLNSFTIDFLIRPFVDKHIKRYVLQRLPIPTFDSDDARIQEIATISSQLPLVLFKNNTLESQQQLEFLEKRAIIEALVAQIIGLSHNELSFILETFPIVKEADLKQFGDFRTKNLILDEYERRTK